MLMRDESLKYISGKKGLVQFCSTRKRRKKDSTAWIVKYPGNNGNIDVGCRLCVARP